MDVTQATNALTPEKRKSLSFKFIFFAWAIEFCAAGVGLYLAVGRLQSDKSVDWSTAAIGALPFFAVAIMELVKIPLATVVYHTQARRWKYGFTLVLILSMGITFETFFIGFEQYQAQLTRELRPIQKQVEKLQNEIKSANISIEASKKITNTASSNQKSYQGQIDAINKKYDKNREALEKEKIAVYKKYSANTEGLTTAIKRAQNKISKLENQIIQEKRERDKKIQIGSKNEKSLIGPKIEDIDERISRAQEDKANRRREIQDEKVSIRKKASEDYGECTVLCGGINLEADEQIAELNKSLKNEIKKFDDKITDLEEKKSQILSGAGSSVSKEINQEYESKISQIKQEISVLEKEISAKENQSAIARSKISLADKSLIKDINKRIKKTNQDEQIELTSAQKEHSILTNRSSNAAKDVGSATRKANEARKKMVPVCSEYNDKVTTNQVYRLAMQIHSVDDVCLLNQEHLSFTQFLWFGSLAFIVSALGTALAFAALVVLYPPGPLMNFNLKELSGLFRRLSLVVVVLCRRLLKPKIKETVIEKEVEVPVEVVKEVPVEKVVFQDVPVEIVKKEVVHVPLFTQDVDLLKKND